MKKAIILFNLGGPDNLENVKPFLFNLFYDPAILNLPKFLRYPLAKIISNRRTPIAKKIYKELGGSSPILKETINQSEALEKKFMIESKIFYKKDRLILRCKRKTNLNFLHQIPIKVQSGSCATNLKVEINGYTVFDKTFAENSSVNYVLEFDHSYKEGVKNKICFKWTGPAEHENKYLKIEHIIINDQIINLYNAEYFPHIGDQWWNTLQDNEKEKYNEIIYGKAGNTFGWYGEINFYFCTGNNFQSRHSFNKSNRDPRKLLNEQNDWIFLDKSHSKLYHKAKQ